MRTVGIIPVKRFERGKSRLAGVLGDGERSELACAFFLHVLQVARDSAALDEILVVTDGDDVATLALGHGASVLRDPRFIAGGRERLGDVIDAAIDHVAAEADAVLVLMGDLPLLQAADISSTIDSLASADLVLAPDLREQGTNALAMHTALVSSATPTAFGHSDSFARHCALHPSARVAVHRCRGLGLDVDTADDWRLFMERGGRAVRARRA